MTMLLTGALLTLATLHAPTPHVLFVLVDDLGHGNVGFHRAPGDQPPEVATPHMDALATSPHGVHLERFYSQPICTPTRTQMLSGRYQIHTGMQHGVLWKQQVNGLPKNETTIAEYLRPLGYATHAVGKWVSNFVSTPRLCGHCVSGA